MRGTYLRSPRVLKAESARACTTQKISKKCHKTAGIGKGAVTDYEVDLAAKRRRMSDVCSLRYQALLVEGTIRMSVCGTLDRVVKDAMLRCVTELQR